MEIVRYSESSKCVTTAQYSMPTKEDNVLHILFIRIYVIYCFLRFFFCSFIHSFFCPFTSLRFPLLICALFYLCFKTNWLGRFFNLNYFLFYTYPEDGCPYDAKRVATNTTNTYLLTPWCRVLLEKLTGLQLVKKFLAFHGTRKFSTALTSVRHLSLSWASPVQSIYPHPTSWRSILILSTHLRLGLPGVSFPPVSPPGPYTPPLLTHSRHMSSPSHSSRFYHLRKYN